MDQEKEVRFDVWCYTCANNSVTNPKSEEGKCDECLSHPSNIDSHRPVCWRKKVKK